MKVKKESINHKWKYKMLLLNVTVKRYSIKNFTPEDKTI